MAKVSTILMHTPALTSQQMRYLLAEARDGTPFPALESMKEHLLAQAEPEKAQVAETGVKSESRDMASGKEALEDLSGLPLAENCSGLDIDRILQRPKCLG